MTLTEAQEELAKFVGIPRCQDCKWKLGTAITNNCGCMGKMTPERLEKYYQALNRARELQNFIQCHEEA
jgi:hypothetical protein